MQKSPILSGAARWRLGVALLALLAASPALAARAEPLPDSKPVDRCECGPIDVVFVVDDTGSMGGTLTAFKNAFQPLLNSISAASNGDFRVGLVTFKDDVTVQSPLGTPVSTVAFQVSTLSASGGMGGPEASDEALNTVIHNLPARPGQSGSFSGIWRTGARKFAVILTDNRPGGFADAFSTASSAHAHQMGLDAYTNEIAIHAIFTGGGNDATAVGVMQDYANASRGLFRQTRPDSSDMLQQLQDFMSSCRTPSDVFIQDDPSDVGQESNPNPYIYMSPDIKVCTNANGCADPRTSPVFGLNNNYVFVRLRNQGPNAPSGPIGGSLYVYYVASGTSSNWTGDWKLINVEHGLYLTPNEIRDVRVKWDNVPAPGHYCLLARWVSQGDPMTFPELLGLNTVTNTQENNNIGWRNVNIVNALPGGHTGGGVVMADADGLPAVLAIEPRLPFPGKILLDLGPELFARWKAAGGEARGVEHYKDSTLVVSPEGGKLYGLPLKEGGTDRLEVTFEVSGDASPGVREVLFRQLGSDGKKDFGGVRWDINVLSPDAPAVATTVEATRNTKKLVELTWPHTVHHKAYRIWRLDAGDASKKGARAGKGAGEPIATIDAGEAVETTAVRFIDPDSAGRAGVYTVESISQAGDSAFSEPVASDPTFNR